MRQCGVDALLQRIKKMVSERPDGANRETAWLAEKLRTSAQTISGWRERGVPPSRYTAIAAALGCTVDELLGKPPAKPTPVWPFEAVSYERWDRLTERQKGRLEAAILRELEAIEREAPSGKHAA